MIVAHTTGAPPNAALANAMLARAAATLQHGERPVVHKRPRMPLPVAGMAGPDGPVRADPAHEREGMQCF